MFSLRRTMAAGFTLEQAVPLDEIISAGAKDSANALLSSVDTCFSQHPAYNCSERERDHFVRNGASFPCAIAEGFYRVYGPGHEFLMLGRTEKGRMLTVKSFFDVT